MIMSKLPKLSYLYHTTGVQWTAVRELNDFKVLMNKLSMQSIALCFSIGSLVVLTT